jgi:hypothetical protein
VYRVKGKTNGNWLIVDDAPDYVAGLLVAGKRRDGGMDKARK